jgi:hypothetical protein
MAEMQRGMYEGLARATGKDLGTQIAEGDAAYRRAIDAEIDRARAAGDHELVTALEAL